MNARDTIAALSSTVGTAGRVVIRVSGDRAHDIARRLAPAADLTGNAATFAPVWPGAPGWVYTFARPRSYTGEDAVEFHLPGSACLARMVLDEIIRLGARQAEPGEFTARAFFNGRLDLTQAEGVMATIAATNDRELAAARQLLGGELARRLAPVMDAVAHTLALVEVGIDFTDEDVTFISAAEVVARCREADAALAAILADSGRFERLAHEPRVVLVGRPNAGKSTLLNRLAGVDRAVVSDVAGTTRDALSATVRLRRGTVQLIDVAGLDQTPPAADEVPAAASIAEQMRETALRQAAEADLVLLVRDATDSRPPVDAAAHIHLRVINKIDLLTPNSHAADLDAAVHVSAATGVGIDRLIDRLDALAFGVASAGGGLALNARHVRGIDAARQALDRAADGANGGPEVLALDLRESLDAMGTVLGQMSADDLLGRIFSQFCIGK